jgi:hypothetical protein
MLCKICEKIVLDVSQENAETQIRQYINVFALKENASQCEFCSMIYDSARSLEDDDTLSYCRRHWGIPYETILEHAPIEVYHTAICGEHNIKWNCSSNVSELEGYEKGPEGFDIQEELGGLYVDPGNHRCRRT